MICVTPTLSTVPGTGAAQCANDSHISRPTTLSPVQTCCCSWCMPPRVPAIPKAAGKSMLKETVALEVPKPLPTTGWLTKHSDLASPAARCCMSGRGLRPAGLGLLLFISQPKCPLFNYNNHKALPSGSDALESRPLRRREIQTKPAPALSLL